MFKSAVNSWIDSSNDKYLLLFEVESTEDIRKLHTNRWILAIVELRILDSLQLGSKKDIDSMRVFRVHSIFLMTNIGGKSLSEEWN